MNLNISPEGHTAKLSKSDIRRMIEEGLQQAERGELVDGEEVFRRIDENLAELERC